MTSHRSLPFLRCRRAGAALLLLPLLAPAQVQTQARTQPAPAAAQLAVQRLPNAAERIDMRAGSQRELLFDAGVERIAIADETVASVAVSRQRAGTAAARLILTARGAGQTTLMVWERNRPAARTYRIEVQRPTAQVEGRFADSDAQAGARADALARHADKTPLLDRSVLDVRSHTVQVDVKVVEFNRNLLKQVGVNLSSYGPNSHGFSFGSLGGGALADAFQVALGFGKANKGRGLTLTLNLLEGDGLARVLAEPSLVTLSGQSASFLSGGELPIPVAQGLGTTTIEYKPYGIGLTVTPTVLSNERIALKVAPEASELDYANRVSVDGAPVPAITTRRADTTVELGDGESFIIGGLVSRQTTSNVDKVPLLGDVPVLGSLFRQNDFQMREKELVIVVTPHLVRPLARGTDLQPYLPGEQNERRDPAVWGQILSGSAIFPVPGFSQ
ncbi:type II and III secretion system protein family protein [Xenophilus sp.]|uniref:type II and III secretion system protein family protein n=1 Tax=Xenophilus sp. TaxID=1873499 RepID=UPI0037DC53C4